MIIIYSSGPHQEERLKKKKKKLSEYFLALTCKYIFIHTLPVEEVPAKVEPKCSPLTDVGRRLDGKPLKDSVART